MRPLHASITLILIAILYIITRPATRLVLIDRWYKDEAPQRLVPETFQSFIKRKMGKKISLQHSDKKAQELLQQQYPSTPTFIRRPPRINRSVTDSKEDSSSNPQLFGWTPDAYPNPLRDPTRCATAYLPDSVGAQDLRLCDPDWVLGEAYMGEIAMVMHNFTETFASQAWDVGVGRRRLQQDLTQYESPLQKSGFSLMHQMMTRLPTRYLTNDDGNGGDDNEIMLPPVELAVAIVRKVSLE